jgi:hypothetical protein
MSHITGTVVPVGPLSIGPDFGAPTNPPDTWVATVVPAAPPIGVTKLVLLHFQNVNLPGNNRIEVDLGYGIDIFTSADGPEFWTRPVNIYVFPGGNVAVRYIRNGGAGGGAQIDRYARGEQHAGISGHPSISNCDPFLKDPAYAEPTYDPFWYCVNPPNWENVACVVPASDVRARVARSVGMIISVEDNNLSTCTVTLVDTDKVITAGHCHDATQALTSSITFDYQTDCAGNRLPGYNPQFYKVKAVLQHRYDGTTQAAHDYSLLQLAEAPPGIPVIQMRTDIPAAMEEVFGVHHPNGAVKKLSVPHGTFDKIVASGDTWIYVPNNFHVSGGSSGSGLFDTAGRILGVLSYGDPCHGGPPLKYFPCATILKDITPTPPPPITRDVMVVFDRSGSMSQDDGTGRQKIEVARDAVSLFINLVRSGVGNRAGLVAFSTAASTEFNIAPVTNGNKQILTGLAPFNGGKVGALMPGGSTSIGEGLDNARSQFPVQLSNQRAILLLTDGMENTSRMVSQVEPSLLGIDIHAIGFGTDANLNGNLLTNLAASHNGLYTRAESGLALEKFFSAAFGNIFEAGVLMDPEFDLPANQPRGQRQDFRVCGEDKLTIVVGWNKTDAVLLIELKTPGGASVTVASPGVEMESGRSWSFMKVPLPQGGERDGLWSVTAVRPAGGGEFPPPAPALRYFVNVIPSGGPKLVLTATKNRYYTGESINPSIMLRYPDGSWPHNGSVKLIVTSPGNGAGNLLSKEKLKGAVTVNGDSIPPIQATLTALEKAAGKPLFQYNDEHILLGDDPVDTEGAFEPGGLYGKKLADRFKHEGNYRFHYLASYGEGCTATRELIWSVHVDIGIDPSHSVVFVTDNGKRPDGKNNVVISITPKDIYGNTIGPGRGDSLTLSSTPGTTLTGPLTDNGDGSYSVPGYWDPTASGAPGVVVSQPGRPGVVLQPPATGKGHGRKWKFWFWLLLILFLILLILFFYFLF